MENDIISVFLNRKKQNISNYACVFAQYALNNNVKLNKIISKIVDIYVNNYYLQKNLDFELLNKYFETKESNESILKDVLLSSIIFYKNSGLENNIEKDINTIVVLSNLIYLAITFDEYIDEYINGDIELNVRIDKFITKYKSKLKVRAEEYDKFMEELTSVAKKDCNAFKKFWKCLDNNNYKLEYFQTIKNNNYYFVKYGYDIKLLNKYDPKEVDRVSLSKGIIDDISTIYLEKLSITILKNLLNKNYDDKFFVNFDGDYFNKNKNIINLDRLNNNICTKKCLVFAFDYSTYKKNTNIFKMLRDKGYLLGLRNIPNNVKLNMTMCDLFDYVFINSNLLENYKDLEDVWNLKNINFITDNESFIEIAEDYLLNRKR